MSTPNDPYGRPQDQQQPGWPSAGEQPAYPGYQQPADPGYQQPYGYGYPQQPYGYPTGTGYGWGGYQPPPRRPAVLIIAGVAWLLLGGLMLLIGVATLLADRLPNIDEIYAANPEVTPELLTGVGIVLTVLALIVIGLAIPVFSGALWARIAIAIVGGLVGLFAFTVVVPPLLAIVAIVLQFLPSVNAYVRAKSQRTA